MRVLLTTTAAAAFLAMSVSSASAFWWFPHPTPEPDCPECVDGQVDINQLLKGWQKAFNTITDVKNAVGIEQSAVNAGNLINLEGLENPLGEVNQTAFFTFQHAANTLEGTSFSTIEDVVQSAVNVVNSINADLVHEINQNATGVQLATNYLAFGVGGYAGDPDAEDATQSAVNAANLVNIGELTGTITQFSAMSQTAINTAENVSWGFWPASVSDFEQTATNVANSITVADIAGVVCGCPEFDDGVINQTAFAAQLASNSLSGGLLNLNNITQSAANVANSISLPSSD